MVSVAEWCEVRTAAGTFRDWTAVNVRYGIDPSFQRTVQLELAEPMEPGRRGVARVAQRLKPGDRLDVALGGKLVIEGGYIKIRQTAYDAERHAVQIVAVAKSNRIREVSVDISDGGQYRGYPFDAIARKVLGKVGLNLRLINPPASAAIPFRNVIVQTGETIGELLERLARQAGLWLWTDIDGTVLAGNPATASDGATLEEGVNIIEASSYIEFPWAETVLMYSQTQGSDDLWGRRASEVGARSTIRTGDSGQSVIVLAEHPTTQQQLKSRTDHEAAQMAAATHRDAITHRLWYRPGTTALWKEGDSAVVKSPMLYPFDNGEQTLRVWAVNCLQSEQTGSVTQVELVNEATFQQQYPDATQPSPFATQAQPEQAT